MIDEDDMSTQGIAEKYGYNHPYQDIGDPRKHPDWDLWVIDEYYCHYDGTGSHCGSCHYWLKCIMQKFSYNYIRSGNYK